MKHRKSCKALSVLLTLLMLAGCLPGTVLAAEETHVHTGTEITCACPDCVCPDCACEGGECLCGDCEGCLCEDGCCDGGGCEDCRDCSCGHDHEHEHGGRAALLSAGAETVSTAAVVTDRYGVSLADKLAEREAKQAAHLERLARIKRGEVHPLIAEKLANGETGGRLSAAELRDWDDYDWSEDAVECEFCGEYIWGDWICDYGDHCSENAGNEDCWSSEHCQECKSCMYTVCEDCYRCEVCWYHCLLCGECFEPNEVCDICRCCESCQEDRAHCRDCGACFMDESGSYTEIFPECWQNEHWHCCVCAGDYMCVTCQKCFFDALDDFCPYCCMCIDCGVEEGTHCWGCRSAEACGDNGDLCDECGLCEDCQANFMDSELGEINSMHCWECETCAKTGGSDFWCATFAEEGGGNPHCTNCCELCPQCDRCVYGLNIELCSECGLCVECCDQNTVDDGCSHGYCLESAEFQEHLCPSCFDCNGGELCPYCGMCEECCEGYHCSVHDWCPDAPGYDEHFCDGCGECVDPDEFCEDCGLCLVCQLDYHCEHGVCPDGSDAMDHFCPECDECIEEYCEVCGGHAVHCEEERESCGCEHDWTCPYASDWEDHFCDDCGSCFEFDELCEDCGLCYECCRERSEDFGCDHEVCVESSEWEEHYCYEDGQCLEYCLDEGLHEENCDHDPDGDYCFDEDHHWQHCLDCEGRVEIEDHDVVAEVLKAPSYTEDGLEKYSCSVCGASLGTGRISRRTLDDHEHVFGGDARCTLCGWLNTDLPRIVSEPLDVRRTVSDQGEDYSDNRASFSVYAKGDGLSYQWTVRIDGAETTLTNNGTTVFGANTATLTVVVPTDACCRDYTYSCRVTNAYGTVVSRRAALQAQHLYYWAACGTASSVTVNGTTLYTRPKHRQCCAGEGCGETRRSMEHNWPAAWEVEYAATSGSEGLRSRACLTCGEKEYKVIPRVEPDHVHSYTITGSNEVGHWTECACGLRTAREDHVYSESGWVVDVPATETETGREVNHCTVCAWEKSRETPVIPHVHNLYTWEEITDGFAAGTWEDMIASDDHYHYRKCRYYDACGYMLPEAHDYNGWYIFSFNDDGTATVIRTCMTCGWQQSFRVDPSEWQIIGKGARIVKDSDPDTELSHAYGPVTMRVYPLAKVGYLFDHFEILQGSEYLTQIWSTPESDGSYLFSLASTPRAFRSGNTSYTDRQIVVEAVYTPCSHPIRERSQQGGFPAGCVTYGKTADTVCDVCGAIVYEGTPIEPIGYHDYALDRSTTLPGYCTYVPVNPRTGQPGVGQIGRGYEGDWVCSVCGDVKKGKKTATHHNRTEIRDAVAPTCTEPGYSGDTWCLSCGERVSRGRTVKSTGHSWVWGDYIVEPTNKTTGRCWAVCESCGEQRICTAYDSAAAIARMGFTQEEWQARLGYTGEDWEVRLTVSSNQTAKGYYSGDEYRVSLGSRSWSDQYFQGENLPTYTFTFESTGRNQVLRIVDFYEYEFEEDFIPFAYELGADGMSVTVTAPFGEMGAGDYMLGLSPLFEVLCEDGTTTENLYWEEFGTRGRDHNVCCLLLDGSLQSGTKAHSITVLDKDSYMPQPLSPEICRVTDVFGNPISSARPGQRVTVRFNIWDDWAQQNHTNDRIWAAFTNWVYVSGKPDGMAETMYDTEQTFIMPDDDVVLQAIYRSSGRTFNVSFDLGGIGTPMANTSIQGASYIGCVEEPVDPSGVWVFEGWYREGSFRNRVEPATERVHGDVTLYARWVKRTGYAVSLYYGPGGTASVSGTLVKPGRTVTVTAAPRDGYELAYITWTPAGGTATDITETKSFVMPEANVTVNVEFREIPTGVSITSQPVNYVGPLGSTAVFTVAAEGSGLTYQWWVKKPSASSFSKSSITGPAYSVELTSTRNGNQLYCVVSDAFGNSVQSDTVSMTVGEALTVADLEDYVGVSGSTATFTAEAAGDGLSYQWYVKNRTATKFSKSSITSAAYSVTLTESNSGRQLYCVVTDSHGNTVKTNTVSMTVAAPLSVGELADYTGPLGSTAAFTVSAGGEGPFTYQWWVKKPTATKFSKSSIAGDTYSVELTEARNGNQIYCVVTDAYGQTARTNTVTMSIG